MKGFLYTLIITGIISCSSSKTNSFTIKQERKDIDSLLLVPSLPVRIILTTNSLFRKNMQALLEDSLRAQKYNCLDKLAAEDLFKEKFAEFIAVNDPQRMKEIVEKMSKDKEYLNKENEIAPPYLQSLILFPCMDDTGNCVSIKRQNFPNAKNNALGNLNTSNQNQ